MIFSISFSSRFFPSITISAIALTCCMQSPLWATDDRAQDADPMTADGIRSPEAYGLFVDVGGAAQMNVEPGGDEDDDGKERGKPGTRKRRNDGPHPDQSYAKRSKQSAQAGRAGEGAPMEIDPDYAKDEILAADETLAAVIADAELKAFGFFGKLPPELRLMIHGYLDPEARQFFRATCRKTEQDLDDWSLWKHPFMNNLEWISQQDVLESPSSEFGARFGNAVNINRVLNHSIFYPLWRDLFKRDIFNRTVANYDPILLTEYIDKLDIIADIYPSPSFLKARDACKALVRAKLGEEEIVLDTAADPSSFLDQNNPAHKELIELFSLEKRFETWKKSSSTDLPIEEKPGLSFADRVLNALARDRLKWYSSNTAERIAMMAMDPLMGSKDYMRWAERCLKMSNDRRIRTPNVRKFTYYQEALPYFEAAINYKVDPLSSHEIGLCKRGIAEAYYGSACIARETGQITPEVQMRYYLRAAELFEKASKMPGATIEETKKAAETYRMITAMEDMPPEAKTHYFLRSAQLFEAASKMPGATIEETKKAAEAYFYVATMAGLPTVHIIHYFLRSAALCEASSKMPGAELLDITSAARRYRSAESFAKTLGISSELRLRYSLRSAELFEAASKMPGATIKENRSAIREYYNTALIAKDLDELMPLTELSCRLRAAELSEAVSKMPEATIQDSFQAARAYLALGIAVHKSGVHNVGNSLIQRHPWEFSHSYLNHAVELFNIALNRAPEGNPLGAEIAKLRNSVVIRAKIITEEEQYKLNLTIAGLGELPDF